MRDFLSELSMSLLDNGFEPYTVKKIQDVASVIANDFDLTVKVTAIVKYSDTDNEKLIKEFLATKLIEGKSKNTVAAYNDELRRFIKAIQKNLIDVDDKDIKKYIAIKELAGKKKTYIANVMGYLSSFYTYLENEDIISKSPFKKIAAIKLNEEVRLPYSQVELDKIRAACDTSKKRALVEFMLSSGARASEVTNVKVADVDLIKGTVRIRCGKGGKDRIVYLNNLSIYYVDKYLKERKQQSEYLFCNVKGEPMTAGGIRVNCYDISQKSGVENIHPHRFRRTLATNLAKRGMALAKIQKLLGHSDVSVTMKYVYVDDTDVANAYASCDN